MSHVATVDVHITDLTALRLACVHLGLEFQADQTSFRWYGRVVGDYPLPEGFSASDMGACDHVIAIPNNEHAYEVGVVRRRDGKPGYLLMYDFWQGGHGLEEVIGKHAGKLKQQYTAQVILHAAKRQGYRVSQCQLQDGSLRLVCKA